MKKTLVIAGILLSQLALAQPAARLYAYSRTLTPGMVPQREIPPEDGSGGLKKPVATVQYYIYLAMSSFEGIQPKEIWIRGQGFIVKNSFELKSPVLSGDPDNRVLVPFTKWTVRQLAPGDSLFPTPKMTPGLKTLLRRSALVVAYTRKGKTYYSSVPKITSLKPVHGE